MNSANGQPADSEVNSNPELPASAQQTLLDLILHYTLPGAATGFAIYQLGERFDSPGEQHILLGLLVALLVLSSTYWIMTQPLRRLPALAWAASLACLLASLGVWSWLRYYADDFEFDKPSLEPLALVFLCCLIILFLLLPFLRLADIKQSTSLPARTPFSESALAESAQLKSIKSWYQALFEFSFNHFVLAKLGAVFGGAMVLLVLLLVGLFDIINIELDDYLLQASVLVPVFVAGVGTAVGIGRTSEELVVGLRSLVLALLRLLLPVHLVVVSSFLFAAAFMGLESVRAGIGVTTVLLISIAVAISLCSAAIGGNSGHNEHVIESSLQRTVCRLLAFSVLPLSFFAAYALWLRVDEYGLTPDRTLASALVLIGMCYGVLYALSSITPTFESFIQRANTLVALFSIVIFALMLTPLLDIHRLSADQQFGRLVNNDVSVEEFDFGSLKFRMGTEGRRALQALSSTPVADSDSYQSQLLELGKNKTWWDYKRQLRDASQMDHVMTFDSLLKNEHLVLVIVDKGNSSRIKTMDELDSLQQSGDIDESWQIHPLLQQITRHYSFKRDCITEEKKCAIMVTNTPVIPSIEVMAVVVRAAEYNDDNIRWYRLKPTSTDTGDLENIGRYNRDWSLLNPQKQLPMRKKQQRANAITLIEKIASGHLPLRKVEVNALEFGEHYQIPGAIQLLNEPGLGPVSSSNTR